MPTVAETARNTASATRSDVSSTANVWNGGVKKKFSERNEKTDATSPETSPPAAAAKTTANTYSKAAVVVGIWTGRSAPSVTIPGGTRPATATRTRRGSRRRSIASVIRFLPRERNKGVAAIHEPLQNPYTGSALPYLAAMPSEGRFVAWNSHPSSRRAGTEAQTSSSGRSSGVASAILLGPAFRSWQSYREWTEASREARLADRLLDESGGRRRSLRDRGPGDRGRPSARDQWAVGRRAWRTSH